MYNMEESLNIINDNLQSYKKLEDDLRNNAYSVFKQLEYQIQIFQFARNIMHMYSSDELLKFVPATHQLYKITPSIKFDLGKFFNINEIIGEEYDYSSLDLATLDQKLHPYAKQIANDIVFELNRFSKNYKFWYNSPDISRGQDGVFYKIEFDFCEK